MATHQEYTTFLIRRTRYLPDALILGALVLVTLVPTIILLFFNPLQGIMLATLPAGICFMAIPSFTMLFRHQETGLSLRDQGLYVNIWPFALGTVPYDNIAECLYEDYGAYQALILRLRDFTRIGNDLPGMLASLRPMRTIQKKEIKFTNFTFTDDLQAIHAAITARLAQATSPAAAAAGTASPGGDDPEGSPDSTQFSSNKRPGRYYLALGALVLAFPLLVYFKAGHTLAKLPASYLTLLAAGTALLVLPFLLGLVRGILDKRPGIILLEQGLYDNTGFYPLGAVRWSQVSRCEMRLHGGSLRLDPKTEFLHVVLSRPDEVLNEFPWWFRLVRKLLYSPDWKDVLISQDDITADLDILKQEIERRLAAQPGAAPQEPAGT